MTKKISVLDTIFQDQLTKQGLEDLREKYPSDVVHDMSDESQFKAARKVRTERNKLTKAIEDRRKSIQGEIKTHADNLIEQVNDIYDTVVIPFEAEDKRRKEEAERIKRELEELLAGERAKIAEIEGFYTNNLNSSSDVLEGIIEAVDLIEVDNFHKDVIHEAIQTKKETLEKLTALRSDAIAREKVEAERKQIEAEREEMRKQQEIETRLNKLRMMPTEFMGLHSSIIKEKITSLSNYNPDPSEFGAKHAEAMQAKAMVVNQLTAMANQQEMFEQMEAQTKQNQVVEEKPVETQQQMIDKPFTKYDEYKTLVNDHDRLKWLIENNSEFKLVLDRDYTAVVFGTGEVDHLQNSLGNANGLYVLLPLLGLNAEPAN